MKEVRINATESIIIKGIKNFLIITSENTLRNESRSIR